MVGRRHDLSQYSDIHRVKQPTGSPIASTSTVPSLFAHLACDVLISPASPAITATAANSGGHHAMEGAGQEKG